MPGNSMILLRGKKRMPLVSICSEYRLIDNKKVMIYYGPGGYDGNSPGNDSSGDKFTGTMIEEDENTPYSLRAR